jgi:hypothetical protein
MHWDWLKVVGGSSSYTLDPFPEFTKTDPGIANSRPCNDCFQFVTGFFDDHSHIRPAYLSLRPPPVTSNVDRAPTVQSHARPLTRIVHGLPASYPDTVGLRPSIQTAVSGHRAASLSRSPGTRNFRQTIEILDAVTLERLTTSKEDG